MNDLAGERFEGNNGHEADLARCLLLTQSRHRHCITTDPKKLVASGDPGWELLFRKFRMSL
jgi:hypothetical protein